MEQYELDSRFRARDIENIFKYFRPIHVLIGDVGSATSLHSNKVVDQDTRSKAVKIVKGRNELLIFIDGTKRFTYVQSEPHAEFEWGRRFSIAYEREQYVPASTRLSDPYNLALPPIRHSVLRGLNQTHLLKITFDGIIPIKKTRPWVAPVFYWRINFS